jgi:hypothetical protein
MKLIPEAQTGDKCPYRHDNFQEKIQNHYGAEGYIFYVLETNIDPTGF